MKPASTNRLLASATVCAGDPVRPTKSKKSSLPNGFWTFAEATLAATCKDLPDLDHLLAISLAVFVEIPNAAARQVVCQRLQPLCSGLENEES